MSRRRRLVPSAYMRAHSRGRLRTNPPRPSAYAQRLARRRTGRAATRRRTRRGTAGGGGAAAVLRVRRLGRLLKSTRLDYRHAADGRGYRHRFTGREALCHCRLGRVGVLLITPATVKEYIE